MKKLLEYIHQLHDNAYKDTKFVSVIYHKNDNILECRMVYQGDMIAEKDKEVIEKAIRQYIEQDVVVQLKMKKSILDKEVIAMMINQYLKIQYPSLYEYFEQDKMDIVITKDLVDINIGFIPVFYQFLHNTDFVREVIQYLKKYFFAEFNLTYYEYGANTDLQESLNKLEKQIADDIFAMDIMKEKRYIEVGNVEKLVGETIEIQPLAIADQTITEANNVICGKIGFLQKKLYKPKKATADTEEKAMYTFQVTDYTGSIRCVAFPTKKNMAQLEMLENDLEVVVEGKIDEYNGNKSLRVQQVSTCTIHQPEAKNIETPFVQKSCPASYRYVVPQPYIIKKQADMFSLVEKEVCPFLQGKEFVVFDLETTGLDFQTNSITEIGAVKIKDGKIMETFTTLVKPKEEISEEITRITGITNAMVAGCKPIEDVVGDFYKFCVGCILVGHNIDFDYKFMYKAGKDSGYIFDHEQMDTLAIARQYLKGMKNYKLGTIAEYLGVKLVNAHRALNDTIATAEVFIILAEKIQ